MHLGSGHFASWKICFSLQLIYKSEPRLMVQLISVKPVLLQKTILKSMGIDYDRHLHQVAKMITNLTLLAMFAAQKWQPFQMDVKKILFYLKWFHLRRYLHETSTWVEDLLAMFFGVFFMSCNKLLVPDFPGLVRPFLALVILQSTLTLHYIMKILLMAASNCFCKLMTWSLLAMIVTHGILCT